MTAENIFMQCIYMTDMNLIRMFHSSTVHIRLNNFLPEKSFFSAKDLHGTGRVLCEVGKGPSVSDETRTNLISYQSLEIRSYPRHFPAQILWKPFTVLRELDHSRREKLNVHQVQLGNVHTWNQNEQIKAT